MTLQNLVLVWLVGAPALSLAMPVSVKSEMSRQQQPGTRQVQGELGLSLMHFRTLIKISTYEVTKPGIEKEMCTNFSHPYQFI